MSRNLSFDELHAAFTFDADGKVRWKTNYWKHLIGKEIGCTNSQGYRVVTYKGIQYKVHRLVFAYHANKWPAIIDHINNNKSDNRIGNLREASHVVNNQNVRKVRGKSKYRGVSFIGNKIRSSIQYNGVREFLGYFMTEEEASKAYEKRRRQLCPGALVD